MDYKYRLQQQQKLMTITLYGPVLHIIQKFKVQHRYNWCFHKTNYSDKLNITCNTLINFVRHKRSSTLQSESRSSQLTYLFIVTEGGFLFEITVCVGFYV